MNQLGTIPVNMVNETDNQWTAGGEGVNETEPRTVEMIEKMCAIFLILSRKHSEIHLIQALHLKYLFYEKLKKKTENILSICDEIVLLYENNKLIFGDFYGRVECEGVMVAISFASNNCSMRS
jgi:hypothetical protein